MSDTNDVRTDRMICALKSNTHSMVKILQETNSGSSTNLEENTKNDTEEIEPKLKYLRIGCDLKNILQSDSVSCIAAHSKVKQIHQLFSL